jgi:hypothetical protein
MTESSPYWMCSKILAANAAEVLTTLSKLNIVHLILDDLSYFGGFEILMKELFAGVE